MTTDQQSTNFTQELQHWVLFFFGLAMFGVGFWKVMADKAQPGYALFAAGLVLILLSKLHLLKELKVWGIAASLHDLRVATSEAATIHQQLNALKSQMDERAGELQKNLDSSDAAIKTLQQELSGLQGVLDRSEQVYRVIAASSRQVISQDGSH